MSNNDADPQDASQDPRFDGPPIFERPTADELPPAEKPVIRWLGWVLIMVAILFVMTGISSLVAGTGGMTALVVGIIFAAAGYYFSTSNSRAVKTWRREHESGS